MGIQGLAQKTSFCGTYFPVCYSPSDYHSANCTLCCTEYLQCFWNGNILCSVCFDCIQDFRPSFFPLLLILHESATFFTTIHILDSFCQECISALQAYLRYLQFAFPHFAFQLVITIIFHFSVIYIAV
jgi:hypothetical protein